MFEVFQNNISPRDFSQYFHGSVFRITPVVRDIINRHTAPPIPEDVAVGVVNLSATNERFFSADLYIRNNSRNSFSHERNYRVNSIIPVEAFTSSSEAMASLNYPKLGYFSLGPGYVYRAVVAPQDTARRGFCNSRIRVEINGSSEIISSLVSASTDIYPSLPRTFLQLISPTRFTPWTKGIKQMLEGKIVGFTPNSNTGVTINTSPSSNKYPIKVFYRESAVARVDGEGKIQIFNDKIPCENLITRPEKVA
jgi:hypothetical protein